MKFHVRKEYPYLHARKSMEPGDTVLVHDNWDDWFKYSTMYTLYIVNDSSILDQIGSVKVGQYRAYLKSK